MFGYPSCIQDIKHISCIQEYPRCIFYSKSSAQLIILPLASLKPSSSLLQNSRVFLVYNFFVLYTRSCIQLFLVYKSCIQTLYTNLVHKIWIQVSDLLHLFPLPLLDTKVIAVESSPATGHYACHLPSDSDDDNDSSATGVCEESSAQVSQARYL